MFSAITAGCTGMSHFNRNRLATQFQPNADPHRTPQSGYAESAFVTICGRFPESDLIDFTCLGKEWRKCFSAGKTSCPSLLDLGKHPE
ncbi:MAG: hypothetical protein IJT64_02710 [Kiritimatiellae bacterium]|nr:hypothetical protein [Kiritimatiellia bacterium]